MGNSRLQAARTRAGKTQVQTARDAGVSWTAYQRYEYGQRDPGVRTAIRIADALGVIDLRELWGGGPGERQKNDVNVIVHQHAQIVNNNREERRQ